jgi:hypothetical protein
MASKVFEAHRRVRWQAVFKNPGYVPSDQPFPRGACTKDDCIWIRLCRDVQQET